jgi:DNA-binding transcriptional MerR regulator
MGADDSFSIDELARAAGMTPRNVRAYRTKGLLPPPDREGRASRYRVAHLDRLRNIRGLREAGLPLKLIIEAALRGDDLGPSGPLWQLSGAGPTDRTAGAGASGGSDDAPGGTAEVSRHVVDLLDTMAGHGVDRSAVFTGVERSSRLVAVAVASIAEALCADLGTAAPRDLPAPLLGTAEQVVIQMARDAMAELRLA